jgi:hypothetical protein
MLPHAYLAEVVQERGVAELADSMAVTEARTKPSNSCRMLA